MSKKQGTIFDQAVFKREWIEIVQMQNKKQIKKKLMEKSNGRLDTAEEKNYWEAGLELVQRMQHRGRGVETDKKYTRYREYIS